MRWMGKEGEPEGEPWGLMVPPRREPETVLNAKGPTVSLAVKHYRFRAAVMGRSRKTHESAENAALSQRAQVLVQQALTPPILATAPARSRLLPINRNSYLSQRVSVRKQGNSLVGYK